MRYLALDPESATFWFFGRRAWRKRLSRKGATSSEMVVRGARARSRHHAPCYFARIRSVRSRPNSENARLRQRAQNTFATLSSASDIRQASHPSQDVRSLNGHTNLFHLSNTVAPAAYVVKMPPTPSRSVQRGGARQRQGSSLHPQPGPSATVAAAGGRASVQPTRGGKGAQSSDAAAGVPFVHPALALSSGMLPSSSSASGLPPAVAAQIRGRRPFNHRNLFARDLRNLMYAYGDSPDPDPDSVMLMEEMTVDFITDLCCRARPSPYALGLGTSAISNSSSAFGATLEQALANNPNALANGAGVVTQTLPPRAPHRLRVKLEDFRHALRKDVEAKKLGRMEQLLYADKVVTEARRVGGVEEAAERAGALQTDNLPPPTSGGDGPSQGADLEDVDGDDADDVLDGKPAKKGKGKGGGGGKGGGKGKGKPKGGAAASRAGSAARSSVQPS